MGYDRGNSFLFDFEANGFNLIQIRIKNCHHDHIPFDVTPLVMPVVTSLVMPVCLPATNWIKPINQWMGDSTPGIAPKIFYVVL